MVVHIFNPNTQEAWNLNKLKYLLGKWEENGLDQIEWTDFVCRYVTAWHQFSKHLKSEYNGVHLSRLYELHS